MNFCREQACTYQEFSKAMIRQGFAFVTLPTIGANLPSNAPGEYGTGPMGKLQFQSDAVAWIDRFAQEMLFSGSRVLQTLDPYSLHDGRPVKGELALYVPKNKSSAISIKGVVVRPPSQEPSCGVVFVPVRGHPVEVGDGWCISFHLAANDYDLDCATRLQCLLQGLCPNLVDQLTLARKRIRLNPEETKRFQMPLACPSATRHPRTLSLSDAILLVAVCARRSREKPQRGKGEYDSLAPMQPNKFKRKDRENETLAMSTPFPGRSTDIPHDEAQPSDSLERTTSPSIVDTAQTLSEYLGSHLGSQEDTISLGKEPSTGSPLPLPRTPSGQAVEMNQREESPVMPKTRHIEHCAQDDVFTDWSPPPPTPMGIPPEGVQDIFVPATPGFLWCNAYSPDGLQPVTAFPEATPPRSGSPSQTSSKSLPTVTSVERVSNASRTPEQSPRRPSPLVTPVPVSSDIFPSPLNVSAVEPLILFEENEEKHADKNKQEQKQQNDDKNKGQGKSEKKDQEDDNDDDYADKDLQQDDDEQESLFLLDDGIHTPLPINETTNCPPEFVPPDSAPPSLQCTTTSQETLPLASSSQQWSKRWYEYQHNCVLDGVLAYKKRQPFIDHMNPVKMAYAFPGVSEDKMCNSYPCVVTLIKLEDRGQETFEVFGASNIRQAINLVMRLHTSTSKKSLDVYVAMTSSMNSTDVPLDIPLDDEIETERVIVKRRPVCTIASMIKEGKIIHAWRPGGQPYVVSRDEQKIRKESMTGFGIPRRRSGYVVSLFRSDDAGHYQRLLAQPKTLYIPSLVSCIIKRNINHLKSLAYNQHRRELDYFPTEITSTGDWLANHHLEIGAAAANFLKKGGRSLNHKFPLKCKLQTRRIMVIDKSKDSQMTLQSFLSYYLELIELFSRSGTILGDAIFYQHVHGKETANFILDVVFGRADSLASLFKETDNATECLWTLRKTM